MQTELKFISTLIFIFFVLIFVSLMIFDKQRKAAPMWIMSIIAVFTFGILAIALHMADYLLGF